MRLLLLISLICYSCAYSQDSITLQMCLDKALANSVQYTNESSAIQSVRIERDFHSWSMLPNVNASTGINTSFGRRLDPFTNTFASTSVNSQSFGLNSSMQLFNGFSYVYKRNMLDATIRKNEISLEAKQNDLKIQVIDTYIEICKLSTQMTYSEVRIGKFQQIQNIQRLLIKEGKINAIDTLKSYNSQLNEQSLLLNLKSNLRLKNIELNFLIGMPFSTNHNVDLSSVSLIVNRPLLSENYSLEQLKSEQEIAENQLNINRSSILPNLSLNGLVGTGFSTNNKDYSVLGNPTKPYGNQISQNLYEGIGVYLSIPIFSRGSWLKTKELYGMQQTTLENNKLLAELSLEKQKLELEEKRLLRKAEQEQNQIIVNNLQLVYDKTVLLYEEGRINYTDLETAFMDWQTKLILLETMKLDYESLRLYE